MFQSLRTRYKERVLQLEALGHRGSATVGEDRAADLLCEDLRSMGLHAQKEGFLGSNSNGARLLVHVLVALSGAVLFWTVPWATFGLGLAALLSLLIETTTRTSLLSRHLMQSPSRNVVATLPATSKDPKARVVLMAHYDTQRTGWLWNQGAAGKLAPLLMKAPGILKAPLLLTLLAMVLQPILALFAIFGVGMSWVIWVHVFVLILHIAGAVILGQWAFGRFVPGANDNATGTAAVLTMAEALLQQRPDDVEVQMVLTGCEETGLLGAAAWAEAHREEWESLPTTFLNIDSLGYGAPCFLGGEYTLAGIPVHYDPDMLGLCQEVANEMGLEDAGPVVIPVQTDSLALIVRGLKGVGILCRTEEGHMPNYHLPTDTSERMDFDVAWRGTEFAWSLLQKMLQDPRCQR